MRLIDADKLINILNDNQAIYDNELKGTYYDGVGNGLEAAITCVEYAPTIEERKHGHWVVTENTYQCQFCQYWDTRKKEQVNGRYVFSKLPNYCPDCGAVMDEEPKND